MSRGSSTWFLPETSHKLPKNCYEPQGWAGLWATWSALRGQGKGLRSGVLAGWFGSAPALSSAHSASILLVLYNSSNSISEVMILLEFFLESIPPNLVLAIVSPVVGCDGWHLALGLAFRAVFIQFIKNFTHWWKCLKLSFISKNLG